MAFWIKEINFKKLALASIFFTIISFVVHQIEAILTLKYYMMPEYFGVWSKFMMTVAGPPPISFMIMSFVFTLVTGISITLIYYYLKDHLPTNKTKRIFYFADLMLGTYLVFFSLPTYLLFNIPVTLIIIWFFSAFIILTSGAWALVKIIK